MMLRNLVRLIGMLLLFGIGVAEAHAAPPNSPAKATAPASAEADSQRCQALFGGQFNNLPGAPTQVTSALYVAAAPGRPAYCDVAGYVNPTVGFGIWLPLHDWNGRYIVRGCGGSCGAVAMQLACKVQIRTGFACLTTDMGHRSTQSDNNWAANNLQGQIDFGYRATHVATVAGKAIVKAFYDQDPKRSYYCGCSTGGRQGMVEAQRFPGDFDGIIVVAPATVPRPRPDAKKIAQMLDPRTFNIDAAGRMILPSRKVPMLHRAVVAACDMNDGIDDGVIGDPRRCKFDPASLVCKGAEARNCLTAAQVEVVATIYRYSTLQPGSELNWINDIIRDAPPPAGSGFGQSRGDPDVYTSLYQAGNPDLRLFKERGGKLINAHGWSDHQIDPLQTIDYYELATRTMGGEAATSDFYRLFMIPGLNHCASGDGAYAIDYVAALVDWVENGRAPDVLIGTHPRLGAIDYSNPTPAFLKPADALFTRRFYPYPKEEPATASPAPAPARAASTPTHQSPASLEAILAAAMKDAEEWTIGSEFPPDYAPIEIARYGLIAIDAADAPHAVEEQALNRLATRASSTAQLAAVRILQRQIADD